MRRDWSGFQRQPAEELLAQFGGAQLFKYAEGKLEIRGGTEQDKAEARDWVTRLMPRR